MERLDCQLENWRLEVGSVIQAKSSDHPLDLRARIRIGERMETERCAVDSSVRVPAERREIRTSDAAVCGTASCHCSAGAPMARPLCRPHWMRCAVRWLQLDEELRFIRSLAVVEDNFTSSSTLRMIS